MLKGLLADSREHDDGNTVQFGIGLQVPVHVNTAFTGHHDIQRNQIRSLAANFPQAFAAVFFGDHRIAVGFKQGGHEDC